MIWIILAIIWIGGIFGLMSQRFIRSRTDVWPLVAIWPILLLYIVFILLYEGAGLAARKLMELRL